MTAQHQSSGGSRQLLDELLHRMTVAQSIEVRVQLCVEAKRELDKIISAAGGSQ